MAQLFISYSRKDTEFARKLTKRFEDEGFDAWVDWQDIPPSVDWMKEIQKGIEEADIFLFLVSADSVASKICADELGHGILNSKRIIPVIAREIDPKSIPATISHLNWIFFSRPQDQFDEAFQKLLTAIQTDYDWVQVHKRLQVKALEWERGNRENSYLLRGQDLQDAEAQLTVNGEKSPHPTDLQRQYITESREFENAQLEQRRLKEQQLELEKRMGLRLRRLTYLVLGVFTLAFFALFFWLLSVTSDLAITSIKDQMLALVETSVCFINGDEYASFVKAFPTAGNAAYDDYYYQTLDFFMNDVIATNENIKAKISLYVIAKDNNNGKIVILASTTKDVSFRDLGNNNPSSAQAIGLHKSNAATTVYRDQHGSWISACSPILDSNNDSVGALCTDFSAAYLDDTRQRVTTTLILAFLAIYPLMILIVLFATRSAPKWFKKKAA